MSKRDRERRDREKNDWLTRPLSQRRTVVLGEDIPVTFESLFRVAEQGDFISINAGTFLGLLTPEVNTMLDAIDPTVLDFASLTTRDVVLYSEVVRLVVRTYFDELQRNFREYRNRSDPGQPIVTLIFDLRHEWTCKKAMESYPDQASTILGLREASETTPGTIPAFWDVRATPTPSLFTRMDGRYPVVLFGPRTVMFNISIPA